MKVLLAKETLILDSSFQTTGSTSSIPAASTRVADEVSANIVVPKRGGTEEAQCNAHTVFMLAISLGYFPDCQNTPPRIHRELGFNASFNE